MKKNLKTISYKLAFTLAEVLIVLGIIGVIAEMTIPTLKASIDKQVQITKLKKFYSEFQAGMKMYMLSQECTDLACTGLFANSNTDTAQQDRLKTELPKIFKIIKDYGYNNSLPANIVTEYIGSDGSNHKYLTQYAFLTADGFLISLGDADGGNCINYPTYNFKASNYCAGIYISTSGTKNRNYAGRDLFAFLLGRDGNLYPNYGQDNSLARDGTIASDYYWRTGYEWICGRPGSTSFTSDATGMGCAARIIENGWEMDY